MLEGYKPIDFSSIFPPMDMSQVRNKVGLSEAAMGILANSEWNKTPISTLLKAGLTTAGEAPKRKQTLWGRVTDGLSIPMYGVANAVDDAIAGHQNNDTDSVLGDVGQVIGGLVTGAGRGIATGARGAFAGSETAADPMDKIYLGDSLIRLDTHMSAEDAMKPENREEVRSRLMNKKVNMLSDADEDKYFWDWDKGVVEVTDEDIDSYFQDMQLYGIGASIVADPLNFVKGPSGIFNGAKGASEVPQVVGGSKNTYSGFKSAPKNAPVNPNAPVTINPASMGIGKKPGSYKVNIAPGTIQNKVATPGGLVAPPAWFDFPANPARATVGVDDYVTPPGVQRLLDQGDSIVPGGVAGTTPVINQLDPMDDLLGSWAATRPAGDAINKSKEALIPVSKPPAKQAKLANTLSKVEERTKIPTNLLRPAATGDANWASTALQHLATKYPGVAFNQTTKLIEHMGKLPDFSKRLGSTAERKKILGAFHRTIIADAEAMKVGTAVKPAEQIINEAKNANPVVLERLVAGAKPNEFKTKNTARDLKIANDTWDKFAPQIDGTSIPPGIRDAAAYKQSVKSGRTAPYSGSQQVQMWNHITHTLKDVKTPNRFAVANNILRQVEELGIARGFNPMSGYRTTTSFPLRLSQILDAIGPAAAAISPTLLTKILRGEKEAIAQLPSEVVQKIEQLKAGEALVDGSKTVIGVNAASKDIEDLIKGPLSAARTEEVVTIGSRVADDIARSAGGSPVAGKTASVATREQFLPKNPIDAAVKGANLNTVAMVSHASVSSRLLKKYSSAPAVTKAINKTMGGPTPRQLGKLSGPPAKVVEWLGARFNAAYKNADMRPIYLRNAASAKATVARRAEYLNALAKKYNVNDADLWNDALKGAQGRMAPLPGSPAEALSREILQIMENLFGSSGLKSSVALENSVAGRSQLFMKELNDNLRRFGLGTHQFAQTPNGGATWLNSWEAWQIEKPLEFLFKMQNVVEHTVREKIMFDEVIARFATYTKSGEFTHQVTTHPRLAGAYFGKEAASQITQFTKNLKEIANPSSKTMQNFDKVLSKWKAGVTIYVPSHHVRNMIGDVYFNWTGGVNSLRPYSAALRIMQSQKGRYEGLAEMHNLTNPNALKGAIAGRSPSAVGKQTALTMKNGTNVTNDMVYVSAFQQGILPTTRVLEDIPDDAMTALDRIKPLGGRGQKVAHTVSEGRDHYVRLAHYVDALKKSRKPFEQAVEEAASTVRKWHPDGMDLTVFERNVMRRMFPFYSWTRKALPLIVESIVATPGKVMVYPKGQYLLQNMMGIDTGPMSDPFPYDQLFPDWIREKGIGPIGGTDSMLTGLLGGGSGYSVLNPGNPTMDLTAQLNQPGKMSMSMLNPMAKIPIELATGTDVASGAPIGGITDPDYVAKQIPGLSHAGRISGEFGTSDTTKENSSGFNMQNIINLITAMGAQNTGPYKKSAEFDMREYLKSLR